MNSTIITMVINGEVRVLSVEFAQPITFPSIDSAMQSLDGPLGQWPIIVNATDVTIVDIAAGECVRLER